MVRTITFSVYLGSLNLLGRGGGRGKCWRFKAGHEKRTRWFWFIPACFLLGLSLSLALCCSIPSCSATIHAMKITGLAYLSQLTPYCIIHSEPLFHVSARVSWGQCERDVWLGGKRVSINTSSEQTSTSHSRTLPWEWLMMLVMLWKAGRRRREAIMLPADKTVSLDCEQSGP